MLTRSIGYIKTSPVKAHLLHRSAEHIVELKDFLRNQAAARKSKGESTGEGLGRGFNGAGSHHGPWPMAHGAVVWWQLAVGPWRAWAQRPKPKAKPRKPILPQAHINDQSIQGSGPMAP